MPDHHLDDEARLQRADSGVPGQSCGVRACTCGVAALPRWWGRGRSRVLLCWAVPPRTPRPRSPLTARCRRAGMPQGHRGGAEEGARPEILGDQVSRG